jgi:hypothetical protein
MKDHVGHAEKFRTPQRHKEMHQDMHNCIKVIKLSFRIAKPFYFILLLTKYFLWVILFISIKHKHFI